jgi:hypothetical protein
VSQLVTTRSIDECTTRPPAAGTGYMQIAYAVGGRTTRVFLQRSDCLEDNNNCVKLLAYHEILGLRLK